MRRYVLAALIFLGVLFVFLWKPKLPQPHAPSSVWISGDEALQTVGRLKAVESALAKLPQGTSVIIRIDSLPTTTSPYYEIYVGENQKDHTNRLMTFTIDAKTKQVYAIDTGTRIPYETAYPQKPVRTLKGTLRKITPPATDIDYHFDLVIADPHAFANDQAMIGASGLTLDSIVVVPSSEAISKRLNSLVGKTVTLKGEIEWGYSESKIITVSSIQ